MLSQILEFFAQRKASQLEHELEMKFCHSCEALQMQLAQVNSEKSKLLDLLIEKQQPEERAVDTRELKPLNPTGHIPWNTRRQGLEQESRRAAALLKNSPRPSNTNTSIDTEDVNAVTRLENLEEAVLGEVNGTTS